MKTNASVSAHSDSNPNVENPDRLNSLEMEFRCLASEHANMARKLAALESNGNGHYNGNDSSLLESAEATALTDRRGMMKKMAGLAVGVAAVGLLKPMTAKASSQKYYPDVTGGNMIIGESNHPTNPADQTLLDNPGAVLFPLLWGVENYGSTGFIPPAGSLIASVSYISNAGATPTSGTFYGLYAQASTPAGGTAIGVFGTGDDIGVWGSGGALGGAFSGSRAALNTGTGNGAVPNPNVTDPLGGPGDVYRGSTNGSLWYRTGGPGSYRRLADDTTAGALTLLASAVRYIDTRNGTGDPGGAFSPGEIRTYNFTTLQPGTIPSGARGIVGNIAAVDPNTTGNLQIDPTGIFAAGSAAVLNFNPGQDISNHFVTALAANGDLSVKANPNGGSVQLVIDIYGYYL
jgi:hypothetical protein